MNLENDKQHKLRVRDEIAIRLYIQKVARLGGSPGPSAFWQGLAKDAIALADEFREVYYE